MNNQEYDRDQFSGDVDEAIKILMQRAADAFSGKPFNPTIIATHSPNDALLQVCVALMCREITFMQFRNNMAPIMERTRKMLIEKNQAYGNSALDPLRIFSKASVHEQLLVRLDDKISRIMRGSASGEDPANDMLGYMVLAEVARIRDSRQKGNEGAAE